MVTAVESAPAQHAQRDALGSWPFPFRDKNVDVVSTTAALMQDAQEIPLQSTVGKVFEKTKEKINFWVR